MLEPYPHYYVRDVFPMKFYRAMLAAFPMAYRDTSFHSRAMCDLKDGMGGIWGAVFELMATSLFIESVSRRFLQFTAQQPETLRFGLRLVRDGNGYSIAPHTDHPNKLISFLFYLPEDDSLKQHGTSFYAPKQAGLTCPGTEHHQFADFTKLMTFPFAPNTCLAFPKTDRVFHGVEPINHPGIVRNTLLLNISGLP